MKVSVPQCLKKIGNRFELCVIGSYRAKSILAGQNLTSNKAQKPSVSALQEIESGIVDPHLVRQNIIDSLSGNKVSSSAHQASGKSFMSKLSSSEIAETGGLNQVEVGVFEAENLEVVD